LLGAVFRVPEEQIMDLFIIRHAWAGHFGDPAWPDDAKRPLSDEGRKRFASMVKLLADRGLTPGLIASSPMTRCMETAQVLAANVSGKPEVVARDELLSGGSLEKLLAWTAKQSQEHEQIAWVGHAPDVDSYAAVLLGHHDAAIRFGKGTICEIRFEGVPQPGGGQLRWLVTAKVLGC
jgi:phosphohistidine phosphatase